MLAPHQQKAAFFSLTQANIIKNAYQSTPGNDSHAATPGSATLIPRLPHAQLPPAALHQLALSDPAAVTSNTLEDRDASDEEVIKQIIEQRWKSSTTAKLKAARRSRRRHHLSPVY